MMPQTPQTPQTLHTANEMLALPRVGRRAVVMTMGALHEGHAALIRAARELAGPSGQVLVTVFVNPLQFGPDEDLDRYPRTLSSDLALAGKEGADAVFAPSVAEVYPDGQPQVRIAAGPMGERLEGAFRPGHFDGMLTVVAKLLHLTRADVAVYGEKDVQQLALISRLVRDLDFPVEIVPVPTVREPDGLALSSRNRYLSPAQRRTALALSRALFAGRDALPHGPDAVRRAARAVLDAAASAAAPDATASDTDTDIDAEGEGEGDGADGAIGADGADGDRLSLDYLALVDPADFTEVTSDHRGEAVLAVAARVGATRLIDNVGLRFGAEA